MVIRPASDFVHPHQLVAAQAGDLAGLIANERDVLPFVAGFAAHGKERRI